ncbi:hypothetical protein B0A49_01159 [Cryomyces minteri]|uniref:Phosphate transporter n=1 Tax=Cryomyces minteri TaxID=331657 RepID=A0A4U0XMV0_9PEZI|nr:hypothetical protein B0A49_01159 [Cryomyces minteri]
MRQAMMIASVCELGGAILVGPRVADIIRSKILSVKAFEQGLRTRASDSHAWDGMCAYRLIRLVDNGYEAWSSCVNNVFAAWVIAPAIAGAFGAIVSTVCKYAVLKRKNPVRVGLIIIPVFFAVTTGVLTMVIVWKGAPSLKLDNWGTGQILGCILGVAGGSALLCTLFFVPFLHRKLVMDDWQLKWYHIFYGPLLSRRGEVPPMPQNEQNEVVQDHYSGHKTRAQLEESRTIGRDIVDDIESSKEARVKTQSSASSEDKPAVEPAHLPTAGALRHEAKHTVQVEPWYAPRSLFRKAKYYFFRGVDIDVVAEQKKKSILALARLLDRVRCTTGATVGVGLCTGDLKAINWRMIAWIYAGWIVTQPCTGIIAGVLMGIVINAPQWHLECNGTGENGKAQSAADLVAASSALWAQVDELDEAVMLVIAGAVELVGAGVYAGGMMVVGATTTDEVDNEYAGAEYVEATLVDVSVLDVDELAGALHAGVLVSEAVVVAGTAGTEVVADQLAVEVVFGASTQSHGSVPTWTWVELQ